MSGAGPTSSHCPGQGETAGGPREPRFWGVGQQVCGKPHAGDTPCYRDRLKSPGWPEISAWSIHESKHPRGKQPRTKLHKDRSGLQRGRTGPRFNSASAKTTLRGQASRCVPSRLNTLSLSALLRGRIPPPSPEAEDNRICTTRPRRQGFGTHTARKSAQALSRDPGRRPTPAPIPSQCPSDVPLLSRPPVSIFPPERPPRRATGLSLAALPSGAASLDAWKGQVLARGCRGGGGDVMAALSRDLLSSRGKGASGSHGKSVGAGTLRADPVRPDSPPTGPTETADPKLGPRESSYLLWEMRPTDKQVRW